MAQGQRRFLRDRCEEREVDRGRDRCEEREVDRGGAADELERSAGAKRKREDESAHETDAEDKQPNTDTAKKPLTVAQVTTKLLQGMTAMKAAKKAPEGQAVMARPAAAPCKSKRGSTTVKIDHEGSRLQYLGRCDGEKSRTSKYEPNARSQAGAHAKAKVLLCFYSASTIKWSMHDR